MIAALLATTMLAQAIPGVIMPGVLDLPMLEGVRRAPDCLGFRAGLSESGEAFECLGTPVSKVNDLVFAYRGAAQAQGWADASGAANVLWMTRRLPSGTCQRLTIGGMWDFERTPEPRPEDPGLVVLSLDAAARCPASSTGS